MHHTNTSILLILNTPILWSKRLFSPAPTRRLSTELSLAMQQFAVGMAGKDDKMRPTTLRSYENARQSVKCEVFFTSSRLSASARDLPAYHRACLQAQKKISQRKIPNLCKCKRRSPSVSSRLSASARDLPAYHRACLQGQEKISQRKIPHLCICKRRSPSVSSSLSASARDLPAYQRACLQAQKKISQRKILHLCICKRRSPSVSARMSASAKEDLPA